MPTIVPFQDVYGALTEDKESLAALSEGWNDRFMPAHVGPFPADAAGQLRWYHLNELSNRLAERHKADFEDARKFRTMQRVERLFERLSRHDPLFKLTKDMMEFYLERLPVSARKAVGRLFARCPHEALEFYREIREAAEEAVRVNHKRGGKRRA